MNPASRRRLLAVLLFLAGLLLLILATVYFVTPAEELPDLLGRLPDNEVRRTKRGAAALVLGALALYLGVLSVRRGSRRA